MNNTLKQVFRNACFVLGLSALLLTPSSKYGACFASKTEAPDQTWSNPLPQSNGNTVGVTTSSAKPEAVCTPPCIIMQPFSRYSYRGGNSILSVFASGNSLGYQWFKNGQPLAGATREILVVKNVQTSDLGTYSVMVSNALGSVVSSGATLTLTQPGWVANWPWPDNTTPALNDIKAIAAGGRHRLGLRSNGHLITWLNYGPAEPALHVPAGLQDVAAIACGENHSLALKHDGTVVAWGYNWQGQSEVPPALDKVIAIAAGEYSSFALKEDGNVIAWGHGTVPAGLSNVIEIVATEDKNLALKNNGDIVKWTNGLNAYEVRQAGAVAVATGTKADMALSYDGTITVWSDTPPDDPESGPPPYVSVYPGFTNVIAIAAGEDLMVLNKDGTITGIDSIRMGFRQVSAIAATEYDKFAITRCPKLVILEQPTGGVCYSGDVAPMRISVFSPSSVRYQWFKNGRVIDGATNSDLVFLRAQPENSGRYSVLVSNSAGTVTSDSATLQVIKMPFTVTAPTSLRVNGDSVVFQGTIGRGDRLFFSSRLIRWAEVSYSTQAGIVTWMARIPLEPGWNFIEFDPIGGGPTYSTTIYSVVLNPLTVEIEGGGSLVPDLNGKPLEIDKLYTVRAKPSPGYILDHWDLSGGSLSSQSPSSLGFIMKSNTVLRATFVPSPFAGHQGTYRGLFYETNGVKHETSGAFKLDVTASGQYTGQLLLAGKTHAFGGSYMRDGTGLSSVLIEREAQPPVIFAFAPDSTNGSDSIHGFVSDYSWRAQLIGDRAVFNAQDNHAPQAGRYTMVLPGGDNAALSPTGDGYATVTVSRNGVVQLNGKLADGTAISQSTVVSKDGHWPFYVPFYGGRGSILSWLTLTNQHTGTLTGPLSWIRPGNPKASFYPAGFTNELDVIGSRYSATNLSLSAFVGSDVNLAGGNLSDSISIPVASARSGILTAGRSFNLKMNKTNGVLSGEFFHDGKPRALHGVLLQEQAAARGFFLGTNQSGAFEIQPQGRAQ